MKYKKILVTGSDGFIGSHLTEYLMQRGYSIRCFVQYNSLNSWGWLDSLPPVIKNELDVFEGDIRDGNGVLAAMHGCEAVLHLAALIGIPYSYHSPDSYVDTNIKGTLNILQAARKVGCGKIVHTSTSEVYGTAQFVPMTETHPLQAQSPYAATKIAADQLALSFFQSFGSPVTVLRPFNTYGPRQSARAVIPTIITQAASGQTEILLGDTKPTRDFSFVFDTVTAFEAVLNHDSVIGQVLNGGSGFEVSVADVVNVIAEVMNKQLSIVQDQKRIRPDGSEVMRLFSDNSKLRQLTNWSPVHEGLPGFFHGVQETAAWFSDRNNLKLYRTGRYIV